MSMLALDKWATLFRIIRHNGGLVRSVLKVWKMDFLKIGYYKGSDSWGNRYFENYNFMIGRCRWVEYNPNFKFEYDASQIGPEWFGWLHYKTDLVPCMDWAKYCLKSCSWCQCWLTPHQENLSGTDLAYVSFSTVKSHMIPWDGMSCEQRSKSTG